VFYEVQDANTELTETMLKILCNNLRRHIEGDDGGAGDISDPIQLKEYMRQYAIQQWAEEFGFEYQGTNSKPSDL
jgi:hypothetical protein